MPYGSHAYGVKGYGDGESGAAGGGGGGGGTTVELAATTVAVSLSTTGDIKLYDLLASAVQNAVTITTTGTLGLRPMVAATQNAVTLYTDGSDLTLVPSAPVVPPIIASEVDFVTTTTLVMPVPTVTDGIPDPDSFYPDLDASIWEEDSFQWAVFIDDVDVTYFRDMPVVVNSIWMEEPWGDTACAIWFPQITGFDVIDFEDEGIPGVTVPWLKKWKNVDIYRVRADNSEMELHWCGMILSFEDAQGSDNGTVRISCQGALLQIGMYVREPSLTDFLQDMGDAMWSQWTHTTRPALRTNEMERVRTGIYTRYHGQGESVKEYHETLLADMVLATGTQWTIMNSHSRKPYLAIKDRDTVHWTVRYGTPGVTHSLYREYANAYNTYYGEGTDIGDVQWRNLFLQSDGVSPFYQPLAYDPAVHPYDENGAGGLTLNAARLDITKIRYETHRNYGQAVSLNEAKTSAENYRLRQQDPGWVGTMQLITSPLEGDKFFIRPGENILYQGFHGSDTLFHISGVEQEVRTDLPVVNLTIDTQARDLPMLHEIIQRNREFMADPVAHLRTSGDSRTTKDVAFPWQGESAGTGWFPRERAPVFNGGTQGSQSKAIPAKTWTWFPILASERDTIVDTEFFSSGNTVFHLSILNRPPVVDEWQFDPFVENVWVSRTITGHMIGWGEFGQGAGFSPSLQSLGASPTGKLIDRGTWQYNHDDVPDDVRWPAILWVMIWALSSCQMWGRIVRGVGY